LIFVGNGAPGVVFGWLYWRRGLYSAMLAHFGLDLVIKVFMPLVSSVTRRRFHIYSDQNQAPGAALWCERCPCSGPVTLRRIALAYLGLRGDPAQIDDHPERGNIPTLMSRLRQ
jgi:hypothetical protein